MGNKETRRNNYKKLRESGFDRLEATKYKDRSIKIVETLCEVKKEHEETLYSRLEGILERKAKA